MRSFLVAMTLGLQFAGSGRSCRGVPDDPPVNAVIVVTPAGAIHARDNFNRARSSAREGNHDQAIADYTEAIRLDPRYAKAYDARGARLAHEGGLRPGDRRL